jgi:hypothetical protein
VLSALKHFPYSPQPEDATITEVVGRATAGEMLSLSFSVLSQTSIPNVEISTSDLRSASDIIKAEFVNLYVVKVWEQAGLGVYQSESGRVAELLLKDDRTDLSDGYIRRCGHKRHFLRSATYYRAPRVRLGGNACTSLRAGQSKQIWLSVQVPSDARPGVYAGQIEIIGGAHSAHLELKLEVIPIKLVRPERDLFIWYKGTLDCSRPRHYLAEATFRAQLQDIYDHGFRSLSLNEYSATYLQRAVRIAEEVGFDGHALITPPYPRGFTRVKFKKLTPVFYVSDEIDVRGEPFIESHIENSRHARLLGVPMMSSLVHHSFTRRLLDVRDIGHAPDVLSYYLPPNLHYFWAHSELPASKEWKLYYYWLSHMEKPNLHRVLAGLYLWKSRADGIAPYCYQHLPQPPFSPFDDFDEWEPGFQVGEETRPFKDHMTTYPAQGGSIPTVQWKGLGEGITDLKYLTTLEGAINAGSQSGAERIRRLASEARRRLESFLACIDLRAIKITSETEPLPYADIRPEEYHSFREQMARDIIALREATAEQAAQKD